MNNLLIKVEDVTTSQDNGAAENDSLSTISHMQSSIIPQIVERFGRSIFSGVVVVKVTFFDNDLLVFDLDFLGRARGKHICARKEPAFF